MYNIIYLIYFKQIFSLAVGVIGMVCVNDADCQDVLSNTVCTALKCACAAGFSGSGIVLFKGDRVGLNCIC